MQKFLKYYGRKWLVYLHHTHTVDYMGKLCCVIFSAVVYIVPHVPLQYAASGEPSVECFIRKGSIV